MEGRDPSQCVYEGEGINQAFLPRNGFITSLQQLSASPS